MALQEEALAQHYHVLKRYLAPTLRDEKGNPRPNRARDKLLRLSATQFHELSTDVYDELLRRQAAAPPPPPPGRPPRPAPQNVPSHLLPRKEFHPKRNQARQKLSSLQSDRFRELAADVFFELERRFPEFSAGNMGRRGSPADGMKGRSSPYDSRPPSRPGSRGQRGGFGPPGGPPGPPPAMRNGSMGGPPGGPPGGYPPRKGSVASADGAASRGSPDSQFGRPQPKTFESSTIVPNKSTLVEDDDDQVGMEDDYDSRSEMGGSRQSRRDTSRTSRSNTSSDRAAIAQYQMQVSALEKKVDDLELRLQDKDTQLNNLEHQQSQKMDEESHKVQEWEDVRTDLENKLADAQNLNSSLHLELERVRSDHNKAQDELKSQLAEAEHGTKEDSSWKDKHEKLGIEYDNLVEEYNQQQDLVDAVRAEALEFLKEMEGIRDQANASWEKKEQYTREIHRLEDEVKLWKDRYAKAKAQLHTYKTSSTGIPNPQLDAGGFGRDRAFAAKDGLIKEVHIAQFQLSVDELLRNARTGETPSAMRHIKPVVDVARAIWADVASGTNKDDEKIQRLKTQISLITNNLITAAKNFDSSDGVSPISLLDAAASHFSTTVIELFRMFKIKPTPAGELESDEDDSMTATESPGYLNLRQSKASEPASVYSSISSPPSIRPQSVQKEEDPPTQPLSRSLTHEKAPSAGVKLGFGIRAQDSDLEELRV